MRGHPKARLTKRGRLRLVTQHFEHGRSLSELATENGSFEVEIMGDRRAAELQPQPRLVRNPRNNRTPAPVG